MKPGNHGIIATLLSICCTTLSADSGIGGLELQFVQQGTTVEASRTALNEFELNLAKQPFEIHYSAQQLGVCASTSPKVFDKARTATDTMSDFSSCLFTFKAFSMPAEGGVLTVDIDGANWLNPAHGAKKESDGYNSYLVAKFGGKEIGSLTIDQLKQPIYLAIWDDKNRNKTIDIAETVRVVLNFN